MSRARILSMILNNQPEKVDLPPDVDFIRRNQDQLRERFIQMTELIGGKVVSVVGFEDIKAYLKANYQEKDQIVTPLIELSADGNAFVAPKVPHHYANTDFAIIAAQLAVAENGAVWVTEQQMGIRVLPFICQHLAIVVNEKDLVANMHEAYDRIGLEAYKFGVFIAGPSKTADIEQSLVLGAHGARSLLIFLMSDSVGLK